jgi:predicted ATPase
MLSRIEIDGFKTFHNFVLDVPPFLAIVGSNAAGKSNFFDAIQFLRRITDSSLHEAVQEARGELSDLFRRRGDGSTVERMEFAVEVVLDPTVRDPWGTEVDLGQTRLRYEVQISQRRDREGNVRLVVDHEQVTPLRRGHRELMSRWQASKEFSHGVIRDARRTQNFLETVNNPGGSGRIFRIRQDGVAGRARPAEAAEATVLSSMSSAEFKHLYALRKEISSWRLLQLEPHALRSAGERFGEDRLDPTGSNLARVLARVQGETATEGRPKGILAELSGDLAALIPNVQGVVVLENQQTNKWEVHLQGGDEENYRSDVASDGTLRVLALLTALYDPQYRGLICFEEPENGVHPFRLRSLIRYLRQLVTNPTSERTPGPLSQVIVNSHSPVVLASLPPEDFAFFETSTLIEEAEGRRTKSIVTRYRRVVDRESGLLDDIFPLSMSEIERYKAAAVLEDA